MMKEVEDKVREHYRLQTDGKIIADGIVVEENFEDIPDTVLKDLEMDEVTTLDEYGVE